MNKNLTELLEKKKAQAAKGKAVNWDALRDTYLAAIDNLYHQVESAFSEAIQDKTIVLEQRPKQLSENLIGTYAVNDLLLLIGDEQVRFSPRGRNIAGAEGRVDVVGEGGEAILILQPGSSWAVVQSRQPKLQTAPFDESSLADVLQQVMRNR